ncbi:peptidyl-prolyl cis-trans isomerase [Sporosarcina sp. Te-1]|uniref:peptidyl-prolyl cis-trans isomerase n=1 Tax=Sporosarcina sp. Te-1 TaxID=2818390 RepID=UPI001A9D35C1|nr:peptidyl-prolyl cis-trans isomerase [Sporosarcina sp. Te-1]QTD40269.1 peptidyl-prolyl cis-trans isomerase [Sporosarcina sp. Te-1]
MKYGHRREPQGAAHPTKRRLKAKPLLIVIGILLFTNLLWFIGWLIPDKRPIEATEEVASVAGKPITRADWLRAMEKKVGRDVLLELVNERVMEEAAKKYGIKVSDDEINLELALITVVDGQTHSGLDVEETRQKLRSNLILEKVLTNDVVITDKTVKAYYEENESLYNIQTAYRTAAIFLPTEEEAEKTMEELEKGSDFNALAKERSTDLASASLGGDLGYLNASSETVDEAIIKALPTVKEGGTSDVIRLQTGTYAVIQVKEIIDGRSFSYEEVKDHIRRELALEQLSQSVAPEAFWKEFDAEWFYGK